MHTIKSPGSNKGMDAIAIKLANFSLLHPWRVLVLSLLVVMSIASGAQYLAFSNNYRVFFSDENPELTTFEEFQNTYTKNDNILFVIPQ